MNTKDPINQYTIKYDYDKKLFHMWNVDGVLVGEGTNGRKLAREAWDRNAEAVRYDYDLTLDEPSK